MKYLLIVNPVSGSGLARREVRKVVHLFEKRGHQVDLHFTEGPGHAEELAREGSAGDYDVIVGGGGDGTINEVLNGMKGSSKKLAIIPWGTGNVFATEMRFPKSLGGICRMIMKGESELLDVGLYGDRRFLLMVGAGMDAYSLKQLEGQGLKRRLGLVAYAAAALRAFSRYRYPPISVELADGRVDSGSFVLVSNTSRYGDFFSFTPKATPLDGRLDVFVFRETGRWNTLILVLRYFLRFLADPNLAVPPLGLQRFRIYRTTGLRLSSPKRVFTQVDGELGASLPVVISVEPHAVELIVPKRSIRKYRRGIFFEGADA
jgi:YegS/Rv2252/BmrU family lipid kinase